MSSDLRASRTMMMSDGGGSISDMVAGMEARCVRRAKKYEQTVDVLGVGCVNGSEVCEAC
jgi:hypothetical protein